MLCNPIRGSNMNQIRAVILAGGKGTRLRPLTAVFPKPLVPLGNRPIIEILLRRIAQAGLVNVSICTGYLGELIEAVCGTGERWGLNLEYVRENSPMGTAGPLTLISNTSDPCIVMNGDLLTTLDFKQMISYHIAEEADMTIGVYRREIKIDFGVVQCSANGEFLGFEEKPTHVFDVSMGVNIISSKCKNLLLRQSIRDMPELVVASQREGHRVRCYREDCRWLDIGRMDDYALAQEEFINNESSFLEIQR